MAHENDDAESGPNPELYAKLSQPYPDRAAAEHILTGFLMAVKKLREEHGVPELIVLAGAHFTPEPQASGTVAISAAAFGDPGFQAKLGALAYNMYTSPVIDQAEQLRNLAKMPASRATRKKK